MYVWTVRNAEQIGPIHYSDKIPASDLSGDCRNIQIDLPDGTTFTITRGRERGELSICAQHSNSNVTIAVIPESGGHLILKAYPRPV